MLVAERTLSQSFRLDSMGALPTQGVALGLALSRFQREEKGLELPQRTGRIVACGPSLKRWLQ
jgi:hypothetical protein